jgi:hypothetical protein
MGGVKDVNDAYAARRDQLSQLLETVELEGKKIAPTVKFKLLTQHTDLAGSGPITVQNLVAALESAERNDPPFLADRALKPMYTAEEVLEAVYTVEEVDALRNSHARVLDAQSLVKQRKEVFSVSSLPPIILEDYTDKSSVTVPQGKSFFAALADALNARKPERACTEASLRALCYEYITHNAARATWVKTELEGLGINYEEYQKTINSTSPGRAHIEGRMVCEQLTIKENENKSKGIMPENIKLQIHLETSNITANGSEVVHTLINGNGSPNVETLDYADDNIVHLTRESALPLIDGRHFGIGPIRGDGNCLFSAIADQLKRIKYHTGHTAATLRQLAVDYMHDNQKDFAGFMEDDETLKTHIARMSIEGEWGGQPEVMALALALGIQIKLFHNINNSLIQHGETTAPDGETTAPDGETTAPAIYLWYNGATHYNSLHNSLHTEATDTFAAILKKDFVLTHHIREIAGQVQQKLGNPPPPPPPEPPLPPLPLVGSAQENETVLPPPPPPFDDSIDSGPPLKVMGGQTATAPSAFKMPSSLQDSIVAFTPNKLKPVTNRNDVDALVNNNKAKVKTEESSGSGTKTVVSVIFASPMLAEAEKRRQERERAEAEEREKREKLKKLRKAMEGDDADDDWDDGTTETIERRPLIPLKK